MDEIKILTGIVDKSLTNTKPLFISDTVARTVDAFAIYALEDTTFTTLNCALDSASNDIAVETLKAGHIWYIPIKGTVKLATGAVIIYQNKNTTNQ